MRGIRWAVAAVATIVVCLGGAASANAALSSSCSASALVTALGAPKCTTAPAACPPGQRCVVTASVKVGVLLGIGPAAGTVTAGGTGPVSCSGGSACSRSLTTAASGAQSASCAWTGTKLGLLARVDCRVDLTPIPPLSTVVPEGKIHACTYTGTPGGPTTLDAYNPIEVPAGDITARADDPSYVVIHDPIQVGDVFARPGGYAIVVAVAGDPGATFEDCPN